MENKRLTRDFFQRDVLQVAPELPGKILCLAYSDGQRESWVITEVEAYRGEEDLACHAARGLTARNRVMYEQGGLLYIYLIYGMHWMMNIVTGKKNEPQAALIRSLKGVKGPGRLTRHLGIDREFYGEDLCISQRVWLENASSVYDLKTSPRIGIDYAGEYWKNVPWRYYVDL